MKLSLLTILFLSTSSSPATAGTLHKSRGRQISRSHFYFSIDLYHRLKDLSPPASNILFSPLNAYTILSNLFLGTLASSNSSAQLRIGLHLSHMSYVNIHSGFREMLSSFRNTAENMLNSNIISQNSLFLRNNVTLNPLYEKGLLEYYQTRIERFSGSPHEAIEKWANSLGLSFPLPDRGEGDLFSGHIMSVLSDWEIPFIKKDTFEDGVFFLPGGERMKTPMMTTSGSFPHGYSQKLGCHVLEIPFTDRRISLFILLPDDIEAGLEPLERDLTKENMQHILSKLETNSLSIRLPRFKISSSIQLDQSLKNLGIVDIFSKETSELSLIAPGQDLYISSILHKSSFEATESVKHSTNSSSSPSPDDTYFEVDHPFILLVWDYYSGMLLLMGRINQPDQI